MPISLEIVRYRPVRFTPFSANDFNNMEHIHGCTPTAIEND
jgi:hypothetical protein